MAALAANGNWFSTGSSSYTSSGTITVGAGGWIPMDQARGIFRSDDMAHLEFDYQREWVREKTEVELLRESVSAYCAAGRR